MKPIPEEAIPRLPFLLDMASPGFVVPQMAPLVAIGKINRLRVTLHLVGTMLLRPAAAMIKPIKQLMLVRGPKFLIGIATLRDVRGVRLRDTPPFPTTPPPVPTAQSTTQLPRSAKQKWPAIPNTFPVILIVLKLIPRRVHPILLTVGRGAWLGSMTLP